MSIKQELAADGEIEVILIDGQRKLERLGDRIMIQCDIKELDKIYKYFAENSPAYYCDKVEVKG